jgi:hypothetical protein
VHGGRAGCPREPPVVTIATPFTFTLIETPADEASVLPRM